MQCFRSRSSRTATAWILVVALLSPLAVSQGGIGFPPPLKKARQVVAPNPGMPAPGRAAPAERPDPPSLVSLP